MSNAMDMSTPVTRGELRQELQLFRLDFKQELTQELATKQELADAVSRLATKQELADAVSRLATKQELEMWGGALLARMDEKFELMEKRSLARMDEKFELMEKRSLARMDDRFELMEKRSLAQLAVHVKAIEETLGKAIGVVDEKYSDLPRRVKRLESIASRSKRR